MKKFDESTWVHIKILAFAILGMIMILILKK